MPRRLSDYGELLTRRDEVILSPNQICLLLGLFDRPKFTASSTKDLTRAALPYVRLMAGVPGVARLEHASRRLNMAWLTCDRVGRCNVWRLTPRGIAIVEQIVPAHIAGYGPYRGMAAIRASRLTQIRREAAQRRSEALARRRSDVALRWEQARTDEWLAPVVHKADELVERWCRANRVRGMYMAQRNEHSRLAVELYVRDFVLKLAALPSGKHRLLPELHGCSMEVNFDVPSRQP